MTPADRTRVYPLNLGEKRRLGLSETHQSLKQPVGEKKKSDMFNCHCWLDCCQRPLTLSLVQPLKSHVKVDFFFATAKPKTFALNEATSCTDGLLESLIICKGGQKSAPQSTGQAMEFCIYFWCIIQGPGFEKFFHSLSLLTKLGYFFCTFVSDFQVRNLQK